MRISTKLTLCLSGGALLLSGAYGVQLVRAETEDLHNAARQEVQLLGRAVQVALENALRDEQAADVRETLAQLELVDPALDVFVFDRQGALTTSTGAPQPLADILHTAREPAIRLDPPQDPTRLLLALPLHADDDSLLGTVVVSRTLADVHRDIESTRRGVGLFVAAFVALTWILGALLGRTLLTRPLAQLARAMGRVRSGDLTSRLTVRGSDEVSELSGEFNTMVADLHEARRRLAAETDSRRRIERGLERTDKLVTIGQLSAGLAHEIGSPLQIVNGRARALLAQAHDPAETTRNAEILVTQTDRIARIVGQLLHFARNRAAKKSWIDATATVAAVIDLLRVEIRRADLRLGFEADDGLPEVHADADQIQQLVLNLITNAVAATPSGGSVEVRLTAQMSATNGHAARRTIRLTVRDNGRGMSEATRERLFEPFFTTRAAQGGTGLGLAVVKAIVNEHHGTIAVESEPDRGTCFTVDLPVDPTWSTLRGEHNGILEEEAHPGR